MNKLYIPFVFFILVFLSGCGTTKLVATWHDAGYLTANRLNDVLIIAVIDNETIRRLYEDTFVQNLALRNVRAKASYQLSESRIKPDDEAIQRAVNESGARAILITRYLGTETREQYRPPQRTVYSDPYYSRYHRYYPMAYREVYTPGYTVTVSTVSLEANLYDVASGRIIWSVRSESVNPSLSARYVNELVNIFTDDLAEKRFIY